MLMKYAVIYGLIVALAVFALGFFPGLVENISFIERIVFSLSVGFFAAVLRYFISRVLFRPK